ncbi:MAG: MarC family protein [Chloroflexota bacterium]|nr:MarC family protein [Chloroflexota bacterium]
MAAFLAILEDIGLSFITIFVAIDAVGILPFILSLTQDITPNERSKVVQYALITAFVLGLVFIAIGRGVFFLLGIEMADFMVAGGLILIVLSIRHLMTGKLVELQTTSSKETMGIVPIGTPLVVGPAVLTTLLILTERYALPIVVGSFVLNLLFAWLVFAQANRVARLLREPGLRATSQIASLLLAAIAVMMIREGIAVILT